MGGQGRLPIWSGDPEPELELVTEAVIRQPGSTGIPTWAHADSHAPPSTPAQGSGNMGAMKAVFIAAAILVAIGGVRQPSGSVERAPSGATATVLNASRLDPLTHVLPEPAAAPPAPSCGAEHIVATFGHESVAAGTVWMSFTLSNTGGDACQLAGDPQVTVTREGRPPILASRGVVASGWPEAGPAATIGAGDAARLSVIVDRACENERRAQSQALSGPARLELALPGGVRQLSVPERVSELFRPSGLCPFAVSGFEHWR